MTRALLAVLEPHGARLTGVSRDRQGHLFGVVVLRDGRRGTIGFAPSGDWRARRNVIAAARRLLRAGQLKAHRSK
jgi:hypothetical protein